MGTPSKRYEVLLTSAVKKDLKRLRTHKTRIGEVLGELETNPLAGHTLKGSGAFRAVYAVIEDEAVCLIIIVGPHENIDEAAERRVEILRASGEL